MNKQPAERTIKQAKVIQLKIRKSKNPFLDLVEDLENINRSLDQHWENERPFQTKLSPFTKLKMLFKS